MTKSTRALTHALEQLDQAGARTRPVSISLPGPLVEALQRLVEDGEIASTSAAATEALTTWAYNRLLRLGLEEIYADQPDLRPGRDEVEEMAAALGVHLRPAPGHVM